MIKNNIQGLMEEASTEWKNQIDELNKELKQKEKDLSKSKKFCRELQKELGIVRKNNGELRQKIRQLKAQIEKDNISKWEYPSMSKLDMRVTKW